MKKIAKQKAALAGQREEHLVNFDIKNPPAVIKEYIA